METTPPEETQPAPRQAQETSMEDTAPRLVVEAASLEESHPVALAPSDGALGGTEGPESAVGDAPSRRSRIWILWGIAGLLLLMIVALTSVYAGYLAAIQQRRAWESTQVSAEVQIQYTLALEDIANKRLSQARQRLEYIILKDSGFPGAADKLAEVMVLMSITATSTIAPSATPSPTPDLRAREELYLRAREQLAGNDWSGAIDTLLALRKKDPDYMAIDVDGLLFVALRNRGVAKIARNADLEGGTYDLSLAEAFGPLDVEARNWRDWAELYIRGSSFWGVDWERAAFFFGQIAAIAPNLMDGSRITATQRYYEALINYGDWLSLQGRWCDAQIQYEAAMNQRSSPELAPTVDVVLENCANPPETSGGGEQPLETPQPSETVQPTEAVQPSETPAPTPYP
jgi:hypothetical protein